MATDRTNRERCRVCGDNASGRHYRVPSCDGCRGFFKRAVRGEAIYECKHDNRGDCKVTQQTRNQCQACRLAKCYSSGMDRNAVQHERAPKNRARSRSPIQKNYGREPEHSPGRNLTIQQMQRRLPPFTNRSIMDFNGIMSGSPNIVPSNMSLYHLHGPRPFFQPSYTLNRYAQDIQEAGVTLAQKLHTAAFFAQPAMMWRMQNATIPENMLTNWRLQLQQQNLRAQNQIVFLSNLAAASNVDSTSTSSTTASKDLALSTGSVAVVSSKPVSSKRVNACPTLSSKNLNISSAKTEATVNSGNCSAFSGDLVDDHAELDVTSITESCEDSTATLRSTPTISCPVLSPVSSTILRPVSSYSTSADAAADNSAVKATIPTIAVPTDPSQMNARITSVSPAMTTTTLSPKISVTSNQSCLDTCVGLSGSIVSDKIVVRKPVTDFGSEGDVAASSSSHGTGSPDKDVRTDNSSPFYSIQIHECAQRMAAEFFVWLKAILSTSGLPSNYQMELVNHAAWTVFVVEIVRLGRIVNHGFVRYLIECCQLSHSIGERRQLNSAVELIRRLTRLQLRDEEIRLLQTMTLFNMEIGDENVSNAHPVVALRDKSQIEFLNACNDLTSLHRAELSKANLLSSLQMRHSSILVLTGELQRIDSDILRQVLFPTGGYDRMLAKFYQEFDDTDSADH